MSTEKAIRLAAYFLLGWVATILIVARIVAVSFNIDPFGFNANKFPYGGVAILTIIAIIPWCVTTRIIGEIFGIKYYKLFTFDPVLSIKSFLEVWKNCSPVGKLILFLIIPEIVLLVYFAITNNELLRGLWLPIFAHAWLLFKFCGKEIKTSYSKRYGKEVGNAIYRSSYMAIKETPYSLGARLINPKFFLFILIVNPLEVIITIYILNENIKLPGSANTFTIVLFTILIFIAVQDLLVLDKLTRKSRSS